MAGTNPEPPVVDDDKPVTEDDLRALKYPEDGVEPPKEDDEPAEGEEVEESEEASEDDDKIVEDAEEEDEAPADPPSFVKEFPNIKGDTPEEYAKNLEIAYNNSSSEAIRLKTELDAATPPPPTTPTPEAPDTSIEAPVLSATDLYVQQKLDTEIREAFDEIKRDYPQASDPGEYAKFSKKVEVFSRTIIDSENRLASPAELYNLAAVSLKWDKQATTPDDKEKLNQALKDGAATPKTPAAPSKPKPAGPKISEAELKMNRKMYPGKSDAEIVEELAPYR